MPKGGKKKAEKELAPVISSKRTRLESKSKLVADQQSPRRQIQTKNLKSKAAIKPSTKNGETSKVKTIKQKLKAVLPKKIGKIGKCQNQVKDSKDANALDEPNQPGVIGAGLVTEESSNNNATIYKAGKKVLLERGLKEG